MIDIEKKITASKTATPSIPMFPDGVKPKPPIRPAPKSLDKSKLVICLKMLKLPKEQDL